VRGTGGINGWGRGAALAEAAPSWQHLSSPTYLQDLEDLFCSRIKLLRISMHLLQGGILCNILVNIVIHARQSKVPAGNKKTREQQGDTSALVHPQLAANPQL
jgi:hypothetical protein